MKKAPMFPRFVVLIPCIMGPAFQGTLDDCEVALAKLAFDGGPLVDSAVIEPTNSPASDDGWNPWVNV